MYFVEGEVVHATARGGGAITTRTIDSFALGEDYPSSSGGMAVDHFGGIHMAYLRRGDFSIDPDEVVFVRLID